LLPVEAVGDAALQMTQKLAEARVDGIVRGSLCGLIMWRATRIEPTVGVFLDILLEQVTRAIRPETAHVLNGLAVAIRKADDEVSLPGRFGQEVRVVIHL
jgi:hypothetical protein